MKKTNRILSWLLVLTIILASVTNYYVPQVFAQSLENYTPVTGSVDLVRISGEGTSTMYYNFTETNSFKNGGTYAFLDRKYEKEEALTVLGKGAVLEVTKEENQCYYYIEDEYGDNAAVTAYVNVINRGSGFDSCKIGGLYKVPGTSDPVEYRYFCGYGGAQDAGPLHAYDYDTATLDYRNVSAVLKDAKNAGSTSAWDYTLTMTYDNKTITLDPSSYKVSRDSSTDKVIFTIKDSSGGQIKVTFQTLLEIKYNKNANKVGNMPSNQGGWRGNAITLQKKVPLRTGYEFLYWEDSFTSARYQPDQDIASLSGALNLNAIWKDTAAPKVSYDTVEVMTRATDEEVKAAVESCIEVMDNEPVEECKTVISIPENVAASKGEKNITITVTDKAGNQTVKNEVVKVLARPLEFQNIEFQKADSKLSAVLYEPGGDTITESGFVWGIMNKPTTDVNNGKATTASPVTEANGKISVAVNNIQKGVTYYGRAYVIADGIAYYSKEISFGTGVPDYGTFSIAGPGNITVNSATQTGFTISRTGSEGAQTVYYRTLNGSAVGGVHFTHTSGKVTFADGEISKTVQVNVKPGSATFGGEASTGYSNDNRSFFMEIFHVEGGAVIGDTNRGTCTISKNDSYVVDRNVYGAKTRTKNPTSNNWVGDRSDTNDGDIFWINDRDLNSGNSYKNYNNKVSLTDLGISSSSISYLAGTADYWSYRYAMTCEEDEESWFHAWMGSHKPTNAGSTTKTAATGGTKNAIPLANEGGAIWTAQFQRDGSGVAYFPSNVTGSDEATGVLEEVKNYNADSSRYVNNGTKDYVKMEIEETVYNYFASCGEKIDTWKVTKFVDYGQVYDVKEPQILGYGTTATDTTFLSGDAFTVSVVFDEIVDSTNSGSVNQISLNTSWGTAVYAGGADTNVLYFEGVVKDGATGELVVNSISNSSFIKDMCTTSGTATTAKTGSAGGSANSNLPNIGLTSKGVTSGTGQIELKVNADKDCTTILKYVWSDSKAMPVSGWITLTESELSSAKENSATYAIRKNAGEGAGKGKWYLHVLATNGMTGANVYKNAMVDFGTASTPASVPPTLTVAVDNSSWATSRPISVTKTGSGTLSYRKSGNTEWTDFSSNTITVYENGYYSIRLIEGDQVIIEDVYVEKIDRIVPEASIGNLVEKGSLETLQNQVYTKIELPIFAVDNQSGLKKLEYAWTTSDTVPSAGWAETGLSVESLTYDATQNTQTKIYLHIRATDQLGQSKSAVSQGYTVISQETVDNYCPEITLEGGVNVWTNDSVTLTWELTNYAGKDFEVLLPDGTTTTDTSGKILAMDNGTYAVQVMDKEYGGNASDSVTISTIDKIAPTVELSAIDSNWTKEDTSVEIKVSDDASGILATYYKIVSDNQTEPTSGFSSFAGSSKTITVSNTGEWYIYYLVYDNTGDSDGTGRPANITKGFSEPIRIDKTDPQLSITGGEEGAASIELDLAVTYGISGGVTKDKNGVELVQFTSDTGGQKTGTYRIEEAGSYSFYVTTGAKKTISDSIVVHSGILDSQNGKEKETQLVVSGGKLTKPANPTKEGYEFTGWYQGESLWDFANDIVTTDITLKAGWKAITLTEGSVSEIQDLGKTYDGIAVSHPEYVSLSTGKATFAYKKKGQNDSAYTATAPKDAGTYIVKVTVEADGEYTEAFGEKEFTISQREIGLEWSAPKNLVYNNAEKIPGVTATNVIEGDTVPVSTKLTEGKNNILAGSFTFTATFVDNDNYKLPQDVVSPVYEIEKAEPDVTFPENLAIETVIEGKAATLADVLLSKGYTWDEPDTQVTYGGKEYSVTYTPLDTDNYVSLTKKVTVTGLDVTVPEGTVTIGNKNWNKFWNNVTFGLFFKETKKVMVAASDTESGIDKCEYFLSATELTKTQAQDVTEWEIFDTEFSLNPVNKHMVYIRITDRDGNYSIINTNGIVLYQDSQADTESVTYTKTTKTDVTAQVILNGNTVKDIQIQGQTMDESDYKVEGNTLTIYGMYLDTLAENEYTVKVTYNPLGETFIEDEQAGNAAPVATDFTLKVEKLKITPPVKCDEKYVYNGQPQTYGLWENELYTISGNTQTNAGTYYVVVSIVDKDSYCWEDGSVVDKIFDFKIEKAVPAVDFPENLEIGENAKLSRLVIPKGFTWDNPEEKVKYGVYEYGMTYTPEDLLNYEIVKEKVPVKGLDQISPVITGLENGKTYHQKVEGFVNEAHPDRVVVNGKPVLVENGSFTLTASEEPLEVKAFDESGNISETFTVIVEFNHRFTWSPWVDNGDKTHSKHGDCPCGAELEVIAPKEEKENVKGLEEESEERGQDLQLVVETERKNIDKKAMEHIENMLTKDVSVEFMEISVVDIIGNVSISDTRHVLEIPLSFDFIGKQDIEVYHEHNGKVETLRQIAERPENNYESGTVYLDAEKSLIYIYSNEFSTYGVAYKSENHKQDATQKAEIPPKTDKGTTKNPETNKVTTQNPVTGDATNPMIWIAILFVTGGITSIIVIGRKKKYN